VGKLGQGSKPVLRRDVIDMTDDELVIKTLPTYNATIYVGLEERQSGRCHPLDDLEKVCRDYCDRVGLCVTVTPTKFIYTNGSESGAIVGFIHYPRFPESTERVRRHAVELAQTLKKRFVQRGISIVLPDETIWIADPAVTIENEPTPLN